MVYNNTDVILRARLTNPNDFKDVEVESLWDNIKGGDNNTKGANSLQQTQYDANIPEHKLFLENVICKIINLPNGHRLEAGLANLIIQEALEVAQSEYRSTTLSDMENAILRVLERYDSPNDGVKGDINNDSSTYNSTTPNIGNSSQVPYPNYLYQTPPVRNYPLQNTTYTYPNVPTTYPTPNTNPNSGKEVIEKENSYTNYNLSAEVLNETADAYFASALGAFRGNTNLYRFYNEPQFAQHSQSQYKPLSSLGDDSVEINELKRAIDVATNSHGDYDEDAINITIKAAKENLKNNPIANLGDLYTEVEKIMRGTSDGLKGNDDADDTHNITKDFGSIENLFLGLVADADTSNMKSNFYTGETSLTTNYTLDINTVKAFLEAYFEGMPEAYIDELLNKAKKADGTNANTINKTEFTEIIKQIDANLGNTLGLSDNNTSTPIHLTTETENFTDKKLSAGVSGDIIRSYFSGNNAILRSFDVPSTLEGNDPFNELEHSTDIKSKLITDFGVSRDMAELILSRGIEEANKTAGDNPTIQQVYDAIETVIAPDTLSRTMVMTYPNITGDFGSVENLFSLLNGTHFKYDSDQEELEARYNQTIDRDVFVNFVRSYIKYNNFNEELIPDQIDLNTFNIYLQQLNSLQPNGKDIGLGQNYNSPVMPY